MKKIFVVSILLYIALNLLSFGTGLFVLDLGQTVSELLSGIQLLAYAFTFYSLAFYAQKYPDTKHFVLSVYFMLTFSWLPSVFTALQGNSSPWFAALSGFAGFLAFVYFFVRVHQLRVLELASYARLFAYVDLGTRLARLAFPYLAAQKGDPGLLAYMGLLDILPMLALLNLVVRQKE